VRFATSGDTGRVTEAAHAAAGYTLTPLFPPLDHAAEPQQPQQQPQQQQQRRDSASAAAASASAVASQLLFSFAVNKATRQVHTAMNKLRIVTIGISGGGSLTGAATPADSPRLDGTPGTGYYRVPGATRTTLGFGILSIIQGPVSVALCQTLA
jgi:hypothetical protein